MAKQEVFSGTIYGIDQEGEVVTLSIYRKGASCRLSKMFKNGPRGTKKSWVTRSKRFV
jgi:hypothetical protein